MRLQPSAFRFILFLLAGLCLLLMPTLTAAQDAPPPEFLYRNAHHLVLVNGYTGETTELPFEITDQDRFEWSPDGRYLLAWLQNPDSFQFCLNLYDVDTQAWVKDEPISCAVQDATFDVDGTHLVYAANDETKGVLSLYNLADQTSQEIYRTTDGDEMRPAGVSDVRWSPTETYLTFEVFHSIMGGSLNELVVMNMKTHDQISVAAPNLYYASYDPIWSSDDHWFLIVLKEEYVISGTLPLTNHEGDIYLVNPETGEQHRLTYTPADYEVNIRWTDDGKIAFTEVIQQKVVLTTEEALHVEAVPADEIIRPEAFDTEDTYDPMRGIIVSPDTHIGAWISYKSNPSGGNEKKLNVGDVFSEPNIAKFSVSIPESYAENHIIIGWRPSDYPYPAG